jgi:hypothetical protein
MALYAALSQITALVHDATGLSPDTMTPLNLNGAAAKFGDRSGELVAWITHSTPMHSFYGTAIGNSTVLFTYGTINVVADPFGRIFVVTDSAALHNSATPDVFHVLGLTPGAVQIDQNGDFDDNYQTINGDENIQRTYQAEWTYQLGVKGFAWDKAHGGASPNDAAIAVSTNWDKCVTENKDLAGVILECN